MNTLTDREKWNIEKLSGNKDYYYCLPEYRKTAAVSMAAVTVNGENLEYVLETIINKDICRAALNAKDADCTILPYIPYLDIQKEGIIFLHHIIFIEKKNVAHINPFLFHTPNLFGSTPYLWKITY